MRLKSLTIIICIFCISCSPSIIFQVNACETDLVILDNFPVDLDLLFYQDNETMLNEVLARIENKTGVLPVGPYYGYFTGAHIEGSDKFYINSIRQLEIVAPHEGKIFFMRERDSSVVETIQSQDVVTDMSIKIDIGKGCSIDLTHITLLKSIYDEYNSKGKYKVDANELLGYQLDASGHFALDFWYMKNGKSICPYLGLNSNLQTKLTNLYEIQYQSMKNAGVYPQSHLCSDISLYIDNTIWGPWEYKTGPFDDYVTENLNEDSTMKDHPFGLITFYHRIFTNPETYWRDERDFQSNLTNEIVGIYGDNLFASDVVGYNKTGRCHVKLLNSTNNEGILALCTISPTTDWNSTGNTTIYAKFKVHAVDGGYLSDELTIEYFSTYTQAQAGFTANNLSYIRFIKFDERTTNAEVKIQTAIYGFVNLFLLISIINRKRKKTFN